MEDGHACHVGDGDAAFSRGEARGDIHAAGALAGDFARVGFWDADAEEVDWDGDEEGYPLEPAPAAGGEDEATDEGTACSADEGGKCEDGVV